MDSALEKGAEKAAEGAEKAKDGARKLDEDIKQNLNDNNKKAN